MRPTCINRGCSKPVTYSGVDSYGDKRWRPHCSHCQAASYGKHPHAKGVTPFKTGKCSNINGSLGLGFTCLIDWKRVPTWAKGMTEIDHIDGNYLNNVRKNVAELCPMCHKLKSQYYGDLNGRKNNK